MSFYCFKSMLSTKLPQSTSRSRMMSIILQPLDHPHNIQKRLRIVISFHTLMSCCLTPTHLLNFNLYCRSGVGVLDASKLTVVKPTRKTKQPSAVKRPSNRIAFQIEFFPSSSPKEKKIKKKLKKFIYLLTLC